MSNYKLELMFAMKAYTTIPTWHLDLQLSKVYELTESRESGVKLAGVQG